MTYNTAMEGVQEKNNKGRVTCKLDYALDAALRRAKVNVNYYKERKISKLQELAQSALIDKNKDAIRKLKGEPKDVGNMPLNKMIQYMKKHVTSGKYNPPPGFRFFKEERNNNLRSLSKRDVTRRTVKTNDRVPKDVIFEVLGELPSVNILKVNNNVLESDLLSKIQLEKEQLKFTKKDLIPWRTVKMAFDRGKEVGEGSYGVTRLNTLNDGTKVIIKKFRKLKTNLKTYEAAQSEQDAHLRAWKIEELRQYITMPLRTSLTVGNELFTVQTFAGEVGETIYPLSKHPFCAFNFAGYSIKNIRPYYELTTRASELPLLAHNESILRDIQKFVKLLKKHNIRHNDMNAGNILIRTLKGVYKGIVVIDWGLSFLPETEFKRRIFALEEYWVVDNIPPNMQKALGLHPLIILDIRKKLGDNIIVSKNRLLQKRYYGVPVEQNTKVSSAFNLNYPY